jgi:purine-binding chemotaxis protein CheW
LSLPLPDASGTYLLLDVAGTPCALPRAAAGEILPLPDLYRPPACGAWLAGFLNLGGDAVPVVDLAQLLGLRGETPEPALHAHVVLGRDRSLAYLVDRVTDLVAVPADAFRPVDPDRSLNGCVAAAIARGERLVHALDPGRLLSAEERLRVEAATRAAAERLAALPAA